MQGSWLAGHRARTERNRGYGFTFCFQRLEARALLSLANAGFESPDLAGWEIESSRDSVAEVVGQIGDRSAIEGASFGAFSTTQALRGTYRFAAEAGQVVRGHA